MQSIGHQALRCRVGLLRMLLPYAILELACANLHHFIGFKPKYLMLTIRDATSADVHAITDIYNALIPTTTVAWTEKLQTAEERALGLAGSNAKGSRYWLQRMIRATWLALLRMDTFEALVFGRAIDSPSNTRSTSSNKVGSKGLVAR